MRRRRRGPTRCLLHGTRVGDYQTCSDPWPDCQASCSLSLATTFFLVRVVDVCGWQIVTPKYLLPSFACLRCGCFATPAAASCCGLVCHRLNRLVSRAAVTKPRCCCIKPLHLRYIITSFKHIKCVAVGSRCRA